MDVRRCENVLIYAKDHLQHDFSQQFSACSSAVWGICEQKKKKEIKNIYGIDALHW